MTFPQTYNGKPLIHAWTYKDANGKPIGIVARYQDGTDKKDIIPYFKPNDTGWTAGIETNPRPLFGLNLLAAHPKDRAVFIGEGEKAASALHGLGITAVTSLGGSKAANKADWTPLNGFKAVYLLPDNDEPGERYARDIYGALMALESPPVVKVWRFSGLAKGADVVDWLQGWVSNWDGYQPIAENLHEALKDKIKAELKKAVPVPDEWNNAVLAGSQLGEFSENPVEISVKLKPVMPFDFGLLPDTFKPWVSDIAHRMQCPPDYVAVSGMVELSAIVGKKGLINPKAKDDWTVCPNLNGLNIGRPSAMKTPASNEALKPLQRLEIKAKKAYDLALADNEAQGFINKEGRALAEREARVLIKDKKFGAAKQVLIENPEEPDKPTRARYLVNDVTIEKLGELLNENPNGLMLYRDEISGFLKTIDREDRSNDRAFYLECFNGLGRYTYDRIGRGTIDIESLCLAILGNIQPGVLRPYLNQAAKGATGDDGMIQRFQLMVWPDLTDWQHVDQWPDIDAKNNAFAVFERLAEWQGFSEPARFDGAAQRLFDAWFCGLHQELRADDIPPAIESHLGKYKSLIPSLAVLVHLADDESHSPIVGVDAVSKAIAWSGYLKSHALRVYGAALDPVNANAKTILDKVESGKLSDGFGTGDVLRGGWTGLDTLEIVKAAMTRLVEYGWLVQMTPTNPTMGGRPSMRYQVHQKILPNIPS
jgi:5S rRNA maturation endonuclease (ribonuclease M5)